MVEVPIGGEQEPTTAQTERGRLKGEDHLRYDAFISYTHADKTGVADQLERELVRFNRRILDLRTTRIFRDLTGLEGHPTMWRHLQKKLQQSRFLIVVACPESADSEWVNKEISYWFEIKENPMEHLILALSSGEAKKDASGRYATIEGTALPRALVKRLQEPESPEDVFYVDFRSPKDGPLTRNQLKERVAKVFATLKGETTQNVLRKEQKQRRRRVGGLALTAIVTSILAIAASIFFIQARNSEMEARSQAVRAEQEADSSFGQALALASTNLLVDNPALALVLAAESVALTDEPSDQSLLSLVAARSAVSANDWHEVGRPMVGHTDLILNMEVTADGRKIVSSSFDGELRVWDAQTGEEALDQPILHDNNIVGIGLTPDSAEVFTVSVDRQIRAWDLETGELQSETTLDHNNLLASAVFDRATSQIVTLDADGAVALWDSFTGQQFGSNLLEENNETSEVAFSPDGRLIATSTIDGRTQLWDAGDLRPKGSPLVGPAGVVWTSVFSPDSQKFATAGEDGVVTVWDLARPAQVELSLTGHDAPVVYLEFNADGTQLLSAGEDEVARLWDLVIGQTISVLRHSNPVLAAAFVPGKGRIVTAGGDEALLRWGPLDKSTAGWSSPLHSDSVDGVALNADGSGLASAGEGEFIFWDVEIGVPIGDSIPGPGDAVSIGAVLSSGSNGLAYTGEDGIVRVQTDSSSEPVSLMMDDTDQAWGAALSPDSSQLATAHTNQWIFRWDTNTGRQLGSPMAGHIGPVLSVAYSPNGEYLASTGVDRTVRLWDAATGLAVGQPLEGHTGVTNRVVFSPDGSLLASASDDTTVRLWDVESQMPVGEPLAGHTNAVTSVDFNGDGSRLVSASQDETVRIWDVAAGELLGVPLTGHAGEVSDVVHHPVEDVIVSSGHDEVVRVWVSPWDTELACRIAEPFVLASQLAEFMPEGREPQVCTNLI